MKKHLLRIGALSFVLFVAHAQASSDPVADFKVEVAAAEKKCAENDYKTCYQLGNWYFRGAWHLDANDSKAKELWEKACDGNYADGCSGVAITYMYGTYVKPSEIKALDFSEKGCRLGDDDSCMLHNKVKDMVGDDLRLKVVEMLSENAEANSAKINVLFEPNNDRELGLMKESPFKPSELKEDWETYLTSLGTSKEYLKEKGFNKVRIYTSQSTSVDDYVLKVIK